MMLTAARASRRRRLLAAFTLASALPVTMWPLVGLAVASGRAGSDLDFSVIALAIPILFGAFNAVTTEIDFRRTRAHMFFAGATLGLMLASIGLYAGIPERVYGLNDRSQWLVLIAGPIFYGAVWSLALMPLERFLSPDLFDSQGSR